MPNATATASLLSNDLTSSHSDAAGAKKPRNVFDLCKRLPAVIVYRDANEHFCWEEEELEDESFGASLENYRFQLAPKLTNVNFPFICQRARTVCVIYFAAAPTEATLDKLRAIARKFETDIADPADTRVTFTWVESSATPKLTAALKATAGALVLYDALSNSAVSFKHTLDEKKELVEWLQYVSAGEITGEPLSDQLPLKELKRPWAVGPDLVFPLLQTLWAFVQDVGLAVGLPVAVLGLIWVGIAIPKKLKDSQVQKEKREEARRHQQELLRKSQEIEARKVAEQEAKNAKLIEEKAKREADALKKLEAKKRLDEKVRLEQEAKAAARAKEAAQQEKKPDEPAVVQSKPKLPADRLLVSEVQQLIPIDSSIETLESMTKKKVVQLLETKFGVDLSEKKALIFDALKQQVDTWQSANEGSF